MRYSLFRRRLIFISAVTFLLAVAISGIIIGSPRLLNNFKDYLQKEIVRYLELEVDVGRITGGLIRPLAFENVRILRKKNGKASAAHFRTNVILSNYRIWDLLIAQAFGYKDLILMVNDGNLYLNLSKPVLSQIRGQVIVEENQVVQFNLKANHGEDKVALVGKIKIEDEIPDVNLTFAYNNIFAEATLGLSGPLRRMKLEGKFSLLEKEEFSFESLVSVGQDEVKFENFNFNQFYLAQGIYNLKEREFDATVLPFDKEEKKLSINFDLSDEVVVDEVKMRPCLLTLNFDHFNLLNHDVISLVEIRGGLFDTEDESKRLAIDLVTYGTVIDHRAASEVEIFCNCEDSILKISSGKIGSQYFITGSIDFNQQPPQISAVCQLANKDLSDLLALSNNGNGSVEEFYFSGALAGKICVEGSLLNPVVDVALEAEKGYFSRVNFEKAHINLNGNYPVLTFHDSRVYRKEGGFFILAGKIDLKRVGTPFVFDDIQFLSDEKTIILDGWDISRGIEESELSLKKSVSEDLTIGLRTFTDDQKQDLVRENDAVEVEYKLQGNRSLLMRFEKDDEVFGLKHGIKF